MKTIRVKCPKKMDIFRLLLWDETQFTFTTVHSEAVNNHSKFTNLILFDISVGHSFIDASNYSVSRHHKSCALGTVKTNTDANTVVLYFFI